MEAHDTISAKETLASNGAHRETPQQRARRRPRWHDYTAFVFSSGGARGALQVGALQALFEHGEWPDVVIGTSIGAWNGAMVARNPTPSVIEDLTRVWKNLTTSRVLLGWDPRFSQVSPAFAGAFVVAAIRRVTMNYPSLYGDMGLRQIFAENLADLRFEDLPIPFRVIASDLTQGDIATFGRGPIDLALMASAAIPGVFPPVRIHNHTFVDGGALESASVDNAIALGARRIFILDAGYDATPEADELLQRLLRRGPRNGASQQPNAHALAAMLERTAAMMGRYQVQRAVERAPKGIEVHVIRPTNTMGDATLDFDHASSWIESAYDYTRAYLSEYVRPLSPATPEASAPASEEPSDASPTVQRAG